MLECLASKWFLRLVVLGASYFRLSFNSFKIISHIEAGVLQADVVEAVVPNDVGAVVLVGISGAERSQSLKLE